MSKTDFLQPVGRTYFQSLAMKYCSSSSLCSQSSTIFSVYRCSMRHDRILQDQETQTHSHLSHTAQQPYDLERSVLLQVFIHMIIQQVGSLHFLLCQILGFLFAGSLSLHEDSHGVAAADVFACGLDDGLTGLVKRPINAVVGPGVGFLDQRLQLWTEKIS